MPTQHFTWLSFRYLKLIMSKTELLIFFPIRLQPQPFLCQVMANRILSVAQAKHLGIIFDFLQIVKKYCWYYFKINTESDHFLLCPHYYHHLSHGLQWLRNRSLCSDSESPQPILNTVARVILLKGKLDYHFSV